MKKKHPLDEDVKEKLLPIRIYITGILSLK